MEIHNEFTVGAPIDQAWNTMLDLEKIAHCLPGAAIQDEAGGEYTGTIKVRVGPITASYKGTVRLEEVDEANHRAVLQATGRDARGQGTASATIVSTLQEEGGNTKVNVETDLMLTGRAAQFGKSLAQDVATGMLDQFAACLEREISANGSRTSTSDSPPPSTARVEDTAGGIPNGEEPAAGSTVHGAVVAGSSPSGAAPGAPTTQETPRFEPAQEPEVLDLGASGRGEIFERLAPALAGAGVLFILFWILRQRR